MFQKRKLSQVDFLFSRTRAHAQNSGAWSLLFHKSAHGLFYWDPQHQFLLMCIYFRSVEISDMAFIIKLLPQNICDHLSLLKHHRTCIRLGSTGKYHLVHCSKSKNKWPRIALFSAKIKGFSASRIGFFSMFC